MKKLFQKFRKDEKGVAAVEYALLVPILSVLLVGIMDYGMFIHERMQLDNLARECVQYVLQGGNPDDITADVIAHSDIYANVDQNQLSVTYTPPQLQCECSDGSSVSCSNNATCPTGDYKRGFMSVSVTATYQPIISWPGIAANKTMTGSARIQYNW